MSKKHFIALADAIKQAAGRDFEFAEKQVSWLADFCAQQNPRFNRARWIAYINGECGPSGGKVKPK